MKWWWDSICSRPTRWVEFYSASSLKQQPAGRHVAPLRHIIMIPSRSVVALSPLGCMLSGEATHTNFKVFGLIRRGSNPRSTSFEASTLTITPPMWCDIWDKFQDIRQRKLYMLYLLSQVHWRDIIKESSFFVLY